MEKEVSTQPKTRITPEEYLERERKAEIKSEYLDGEMFSMSGATSGHTTIVFNIATELNMQLIDRPGSVYGLDLRLKVSPTGLYTYPDLVALCGEPEFEDEMFDTLLNPQLIIEVLSKSTESYDRAKSSPIIEPSNRCANTFWSLRLNAAANAFYVRPRGTGFTPNLPIRTDRSNSRPLPVVSRLPVSITKSISSARRRRQHANS